MPRLGQGFHVQHGEALVLAFWKRMPVFLQTPISSSSCCEQKQDKKKMFPARCMVSFVQCRVQKDRILPKQGQKERKMQETRGNMFAQA
ncbi:hypothetical protein B5F76_02780 [Desulfovibrio sp. An276]|nr:hypothetical protein B5F76_02780 [Desulfovibrio sp. An276]